MPTTIVTLGHRPSLQKFHKQVLRLFPNSDIKVALEDGAGVAAAPSNDDQGEQRR
jgi:ABC-type uncharacterized transport system fused permease/ATPase subunit